MNAAIIVEGPDDVAVYQILVKRINRAIERIYARECLGRQKLKNKFVYLLGEFASNPHPFNLATAIVIRDSDCNDPQRIEQELQDIFVRLGQRMPFPVRFHATKCKLECWLLADEQAINSVSMLRGGAGGIQPIAGDLESLREADVIYRQTLSKAGLQDTGQVMREIAQRARLERIAERCPRFRNFTQKIAGPPDAGVIR